MKSFMYVFLTGGVEIVNAKGSGQVHWHRAMSSLIIIKVCRDSILHSNLVK